MHICREKQKIARVLVVMWMMVIPLTGFSHMTTQYIEVVSFSATKKDEYRLVFRVYEPYWDSRGGAVPLFAVPPSKLQVVHVRHDPRRAAGNDIFRLSYDEYQQAIMLLKEQATFPVPFKIALMSGAGYSKIKNRPGEFRTNALNLCKLGGKKEYVCFFHSVWGTSPD